MCRNSPCCLQSLSIWCHIRMYRQLQLFLSRLVDAESAWYVGCMGSSRVRLCMYTLSVFRVAVIIRVKQKWGPLIPCAKECLCIIFIENGWSRCISNYNTRLSIYLAVAFDLFTVFERCAVQAFGIVIPEEWSIYNYSSIDIYFLVILYHSQLLRAVYLEILYSSKYCFMRITCLYCLFYIAASQFIKRKSPRSTRRQ